MPPRSLAPELDPNDAIQFVGDHRVSLAPGDYVLSVSQTRIPESNSSKRFSVLAERFELNPQTVHAEFPPAGSRGDFQADLPHVILNRSTLPWERTAKVGGSQPGQDPPWLGLLLFHQDEAQEIKASTVALSELQKDVPASPYFPKITLETGQDGKDRARVIDVKRSVLDGILPVDLQYHAHARRRLAFLPLPADAPNPPADAAGAKSVLESALKPARLGTVVVAETKPSQRWHFRDLAQRAEYEVWHDGAENRWKAYRLDVETAVVLGNRLPQPGQRNVVHLVSLEGRYASGAFDHQAAKPDDAIRLISLYSWEFFCTSSAHTFTGLLEGLNRTSLDVEGGTLRLSPDAGKAAAIENATVDARTKTLNKAGGEVGKITDGDWTGAKSISEAKVGQDVLTYDVLDQQSQPLRNLDGTIQLNHLEASSEFGLPVSAANDSADVARFFRAGLVPLRHSFRQGDRSVSWYHGPLLPQVPDGFAPVIKLSAGNADQLLIYDPHTAMFDASYAAAWELGRMLTLQNRNVALSLFHWKRSHARALERSAPVRSAPERSAPERSAQDHDVAALANLFRALSEPFLEQLGLRSPEELACPPAVADWLRELGHLVHVPFQYLVPDERLLPPESIRFFSLDPLWLNCLFDGAFSLGGKLPDKAKVPAFDTLFPRQDDPRKPKTRARSGFLLRSEAVAGWPGLRVDGYSKLRKDKVSPPEGKLDLLRMERLSQSVLLCLFAGDKGDDDLLTLDVHLRPETLHFGFEREESGFRKTLRNADTGEATGPRVTVQPSSGNNVVNFRETAQTLKATDMAAFALQMVAGVEAVRFTRAK